MYRGLTDLGLKKQQKHVVYIPVTQRNNKFVSTDKTKKPRLGY